MKQTIKQFALTAMSLMIAFAALAQVTTSSMSGRVTEANGAPVAGAAVVAVHTPSGSQYYSITDNAGNYRIQNMRVGGPYAVEVSLLGFGNMKTGNIVLKLGENYVLDVKLSEQAIALNEVVVSAGISNPILNSDRTGASMNIGSKQLQTLPSISRSITDFTRMTPQANGTSFGGRDGRFNTITIDGAAFNNNFGLSSNAMPGGNAQPISLDAIEEVSVNLAPYDVRLSQFTGASINAVTKSGDNRYKATLYTYQRPKSFTGNKVGDLEVPGANDKSAATYGLTVGGPIIKNKLFFFLSGEIEKETTPSNSWEPSVDGVSNSAAKISRTKISDLQKVSDYVKSTFGYDAGKFQNFDNFESENYKIMARLDWNINKNHKLTFRYNDVKSTNDVLTNGSSGPSQGSNLSGRISAQSISFQNSFYGFENTVRSFTGELNSVFGNNISNKLLVSYTKVRDKRTSPSSIFPFIDIYEGNDRYMSLGYELFSFNNDVKNNTLSITNNTTINLGSHTLTAGLSYDNLFFFNSYIREGTSFYKYNSVQDFLDNKVPSIFAVTYGYNGNDAPGAELTFGMASAYVQDEWQISKKFKLTYGLRAEMPLYHNKLENNPAISALTFGDGWTTIDGNLTPSWAYKMDVGSWPKSKIQISPRVGFNWDVKGDRSLQLRGGTGIFTGMLPFVWFTNQPTNSGMIQSVETIITNSTTLASINFNNGALKFNPNFRQVVDNNPTIFNQNKGALPSTGASLAEVSKDFKMPQVWRTNIAMDLELPSNMILTLEAIYSKDINAITQKNVNLSYPQGNYAGADTRPFWNTNKINTNIGNAMVLSNTNEGYQASFTAQLSKNFSNGLYGMIAYTYNIAKDVTANPGSAAYSAWRANTTTKFLNDPELSYSNFSTPHRIVGNISYKIEYAKHFATTISLYYSGSNQGRSSYTYSNDMNKDGQTADLIYIPKDASEIVFADFKNKNGVVVLTAQEQSDRFMQYIEETPYLRNNKGKYAERYGDVQPWYNRFDMKILQDLFTNFGSERKYTLQLSLDILNVGNLLNSNWGVYQTHGLGSYENIRPLTFVTKGADNKPQYNLFMTPTTETNKDVYMNDFNKKAKWNNNLSTGSTWGMQLGIRFIF